MPQAKKPHNGPNGLRRGVTLRTVSRFVATDTRPSAFDRAAVGYHDGVFAPLMPPLLTADRKMTASVYRRRSLP